MCVGTIPYKLVVSNICEPLYLLFEALLDINQFFNDSPEGREGTEYEFEFIWDGEPLSYEWVFKPLDRPLTRLSVKSLFEEKTWAVDFVVDYFDLLAQVCSQTTRLLWRYGFSGYNHRWFSHGIGQANREFPTGRLVQLYYVLRGGDEMEVPAETERSITKEIMRNW